VEKGVVQAHFARRTTVPDPILATFLDAVEAFRLGLRRRSYVNMVIVACGWLLTQGHMR
jgi:hypothetical protein